MSKDSAVNLKPFCGKEEDWVFWVPIVMARANVKGYCGIAEAEEEIPNDNETMTDARKIKLRSWTRLGIQS